MGKKVNSTVIIYNHAIKKLTDAQILALKLTAEELLENVRDAQVIPRDSGHLQGDATVVDESQAKSGTVSLVSQTPYARRLYFHPEYNFSKRDNKNAQGKWYEPWIIGNKKDFCKETFAKIYKQLGGV
jgi:hypothetical protein